MASLSMRPPPGGNQDRMGQVMGIFWTECGVALVVVMLRLYSRLMIKNLGLDDHIMFVTMVKCPRLLWVSLIKTDRRLTGVVHCSLRSDYGLRSTWG